MDADRNKSHRKKVQGTKRPPLARHKWLGGGRKIVSPVRGLFWPVLVAQPGEPELQKCRLATHSKRGFTHCLGAKVVARLGNAKVVARLGNAKVVARLGKYPRKKTHDAPVQ